MNNLSFHPTFILFQYQFSPTLTYIKPHIFSSILTCCKCNFTICQKWNWISCLETLPFSSHPRCSCPIKHTHITHIHTSPIIWRPIHIFIYASRLLEFQRNARRKLRANIVKVEHIYKQLATSRHLSNHESYTMRQHAIFHCLLPYLFCINFIPPHPLYFVRVTNQIEWFVWKIVDNMTTRLCDVVVYADRIALLCHRRDQTKIKANNFICVLE